MTVLVAVLVADVDVRAVLVGLVVAEKEMVCDAVVVNEAAVTNGGSENGGGTLPSEDALRAELKIGAFAPALYSRDEENSCKHNVDQKPAHMARRQIEEQS